MPNSLEHSTAGCIASSCLLAIWELSSQSAAIKRNPYARMDRGAVMGKAATGGIVGSVAGILPDIFEPATNPRHRGFFHSKSAAVLATVGLGKLGMTRMGTAAKQVLACIVLGYLTHLHDDSKTESGLPVL